MKKAGLLILVPMLVLILTACGGGSPEPVSMDIDMADFSFAPSSSSFPAGTEVTINLTNSGTVEHEMLIFQWDGDDRTDIFDHDPSQVVADDSDAGFKVGSAEEIDEEGYHVELESGGSGSMTFTVPADKAGEWVIACFIDEGAHFAAGMEGTITVTAP